MPKQLVAALVAIIAVLVLWIAVLLTPAIDFLGLTGLLHAPIPDSAQAHPIDPETGTYLQEIGEGVYFLSGWSHNTMFVVSEQSVIVVDAPPSIGEAYLDAIREVTDKPVSHLIYSHAHDDHIGAADIFDDPIIVAHETTAEALAEKDDPSRPVPTLTFADAYTLEVGGKRIELAYHGPAHSPGNIAIHLPEERVLAMIDIAFPQWIPIHEFAIAEDLDAYFQIYDELLAYDFTHFVGGHAKLGSYQDVQRQHEYALDVKESAAAALATVDISQLGERAGTTPNSYATVSFGLDRVAKACEREVVARWRGRLAGVDVFTHSHCLRMVFYAMTD